MPFCDPSLELEDRVTDYTKRIPTENQILMMSNLASGFQPLHIPPYQWWSEGLHGPLEPCVQYQDKCACPTSFPCPSALGAAFNTTLYHQIGAAIGKEGRAIANLRKHNNGIGDGITYWSPTINLQRDPRWGRNQEVPGEDPHLTGQYSAAFVKGLQGTGTKLQMGACCKHFIANSLEGRPGVNFSRYNFDARIDDADLNDYYLPPFRDCVKEAIGVMCSYNALNGVPTCANEWLLKTKLREEWNFTGYIVSDCGALACIYNDHHYAKDSIEAAAQSKNASVDINCGNGVVYPEGLLGAYGSNLVEEATIRNSFTRMARLQFQLGLFDPKDFDPNNDIATVGSHSDLALEAALQSIVLLQSKNNLLPLNPNKNIAVIGPHINASGALLSNYHGDACGCSKVQQKRCKKTPTEEFLGMPCGSLQGADCIETPYQALAKKSNLPVVGVKGCLVDGYDFNQIEDATKVAKNSEAVILLMGLDQSQESEGLDRNQTFLPGLQQELIQAVLNVASDKTILVLIHGGSVTLGQFVLDHASAIVSASYGGEAASQALASVLYGEYNPTGKLAATMYPPSFMNEMQIQEMGLRVGVGRTHLYYKGKPEFPFGHGLSYSAWGLEWGDNEARSSLELSDSDPMLRTTIRVKNNGPKRGRQTVLMFWRPHSSLGIQQKLIGFQGTQDLKVGEEEVLEFALDINDFKVWDDGKKGMDTLAGTHLLEVRASNAELKKTLYLNKGPSTFLQFAEAVAPVLGYFQAFR